MADRRGERVEGIGGFFFNAADPAALSLWYAQHLGVNVVPQCYEDDVWWQEAGPTVFAPLSPAPEANALVGASGWGINFRVRDLDTLVAQLRSAGIVVDVDAEHYPNGRFAQLQDPEGNAIQLWEPA